MIFKLFEKKKKGKGYIIRLFYPKISKDYCIFTPTLLKMRLETSDGYIIDEDFFDEFKLKMWRIEFPYSIVVEERDFNTCEEPLSYHLLGRIKILEEY